jgi:hypothetical protein
MFNPLGREEKKIDVLIGRFFFYEKNNPREEMIEPVNRRGLLFVRAILSITSCGNNFRLA